MKVPSLQRKSSRAILASLLFILLILVGVFWNGLHSGFFFDDSPSILEATGVRMEKLSFASLHDALTSGISGPTQRPLSQLSFALNHYVSGFDPFVFKLTNLVIHAINGLLVFLLALRLINPYNRRNKASTPLVIAGLVSAAWLLHPIQLLPVLHVVQRMTSLSAAFLLAAFLLHISTREHDWSSHKGRLIAAWFFLWPLSVLSKETGLLFPLFVLAWEVIIRAPGYGMDRFSRTLAAAMVAILLTAAAYLITTSGRWILAGYEFRDFSLGERLLTEGRVLWFYLSMIAFPRLDTFGLQHDDIAISTNLLSPWTTLASLIGLLALTSSAWILRKRLPLASFGIAWFLVGHLMESTILPLEIAHEHRNYLPLFGILLSVFSLLTKPLKTNGVQKTLSLAFSAAFIVFLAFITALRAHAFGDTLRLSQFEVEHHEKSPRAQYEAGRALASLPAAADPASPIYSFARKHYEKNVKLDNNSKFGLVGLIHLNCQAGVTVERSWIDTLAHRLQKTRFSPGDSSMMYNVKEMSITGAFCLPREDIENLFDAAQGNPKISPAIGAKLLSWRADYLWLGQHDLAAARESLAKSLKLAPHNPSNQLKWAQLLFLSSEREEAKQLLIALRNAKLAGEERNTRKELLAALGVAEQ